MKELHLIKSKIALNFLLPIIFDWIYATIGLSDEVWRWLNPKYKMSRIVQNCIWWNKNSLFFLLPMVSDWINEIMNDIDDFWRWVHQKYGTSRIGQKLHQ